MNDLAVRVSNLNLSYRYVRRMKIKNELTGILTGRRRSRSKEIWALRGLTFEVRKGMTVGVIGDNGSGKTTLLKAVAGVFAPDSGTVETFRNTVSLLALGVGFDRELTGRENVYCNALLLGMTRFQVDERLQDIIAFSELDDFIDRPIKTYSAGMRARLAFSVAVHVDPDILLIDEVLGVGDASFQEKSKGRMHAMVEGNRTVMIVSHNLGLMTRLCQQILWLDHGKVVEFGEPSEVVGRYRESVRKESRQGAREREARG